MKTNLLRNLRYRTALFIAGFALSLAGCGSDAVDLGIPMDTYWTSSSGFPRQTIDSYEASAGVNIEHQLQVTQRDGLRFAVESYDDVESISFSLEDRSEYVLDMVLASKALFKEGHSARTKTNPPVWKVRGTLRTVRFDSRVVQKNDPNCGPLERKLLDFEIAYTLEAETEVDGQTEFIRSAGRIIRLDSEPSCVHSAAL